MKKNEDMGAIENIEQLKTLFKKCAEDEKDVWRHSNNETSRIRFEARKNVLCQYQKEIEQLAGDVLDLCKDLIDANKDLQFKEYHDVFDEINNSSLWLTVIPLIVNNFQRLKWIEKKEREEGWNYYIADKGYDVYGDRQLDLIFEMVVNGKVLSQKIEGIYKENRVLLDYAGWKNTFEFKVCSPLSEYIYNKGVDAEDVMSPLLETLAQAVCLYIALKNEKVKLYRQNGYFPETQTKAAEGATKTKPEVKKAKKPESTTQGEEDKTTLAEKKMDKEWIQKVFTARANKYFAKAIEVGYMQEKETGYLWTYSNELQPIVYFFIRIYDKGRPQYKMLRKLFSITSRLNNVATELRKAGWYSDDSKRDQLIAQGKDPEKDASHKLKDPPEWYIELKQFFDEQ